MRDKYGKYLTNEEKVLLILKANGLKKRCPVCRLYNCICQTSLNKFKK